MEGEKRKRRFTSHEKENALSKPKKIKRVGGAGDESGGKGGTRWRTVCAGGAVATRVARGPIVYYVCGKTPEKMAPNVVVMKSCFCDAASHKCCRRARGATTTRASLSLHVCRAHRLTRCAGDTCCDSCLGAFPDLNYLNHIN